MITPEKRVKWDLLVFAVIVASAFVIPYDLLVGWKNKTLEAVLDYTFIGVFLLDMVLNCLTVQRKSYGGFWGWRHIVGLFFSRVAPWRAAERDGGREIVYARQPQACLCYLTSGWFLIDFLAVAPFNLLLRNLGVLRMARTFRLARLPRLLRVVRSLRALRGIKAVRTTTILKNVFGLHPALGRLVFLGILVLWLGHLHACVFYAAEVGNEVSAVATYGDALRLVFVSFTTCDQAQAVTGLGFWTSVSAVVVGVSFFAAFVGNFAALFGEMDQNTALYEERRREWTGFFKSFRGTFDRRLQERILRAVNVRIVAHGSVARHADLIRSLDPALGDEVKARLARRCKERPSKRLEELLSKLADTGDS